MKKFNELKKELVELISSRGDSPATRNLINGVIALSNPLVKVYYNFSIQSFKYLILNSSLEEFDKTLKNLDASKVYSFKDYEELEDFLDYLLEEKEIELYNDINKNVVEINKNLYMFEEN